MDLVGVGMFTASAALTAALRGYRTYKPILAARRARASITAQRSLLEAVKRIEEVIQRDEGKRGIREIIPEGDELLHAAQDMLRASSVAIVTGFPCLLDYSPPTETDGPLGALALAKALLAMGKRVRVLTDECNEEVLLACTAGANLARFGESFSLESFPPLEGFDEGDERRLEEVKASIDLVIAIERAGPNAQGRYCTMRCRDMTHIVAPLDLLFEPSEEALLTTDRPVLKTKINSIGIGDGGNEVGMGKIYHTIVNSSINHAQEIACAVPANHLIVCSVSNWGGYGLAAAAALVHAHEQSLPLEEAQRLLNEYLPTDEEETNKCSRSVAAGARDGMTAKQEMMVDGMPFSESLRVIDELKRILSD